ncbi:TetR/AcrR family transcriptional regulator [Lactiplantibacillus plantarum]|uniref:TetR/AcrR family transcriptional regulator n=1 Tax=Lactiplantibacillus plantarum TaxID=1590 RepID=UPI0032E460E9
MANQKNQRMQATILLAYENLLSDKPFRKITVQDISDAALVHRSTFYKHFQDQ